jgi:hypothetical protein
VKVTVFTLIVSTLFLSGYVALSQNGVLAVGAVVLVLAAMGLWRYETSATG